MSEDLPNVLAGRYASAEMKNLWSQSGKIVMERGNSGLRLCGPSVSSESKSRKVRLPIRKKLS